MAGPLRITNCEATAPGTIVVTFSEPVFATPPGGTPAFNDATNKANYGILILPSGGTPQPPLPGSPTIRMVHNDMAAIIILDTTAAGITLQAGHWIQIQVDNVTPRGGGAAIAAPHNMFFTQVHSGDVGVAASDIARDTGRIARDIGGASQAVEDIASFSVLTEEIGFPPSPLARPSGGGGAMAPAAGGTLGQIAAKAVSDVLGWQAKTDAKGFVGALNASFKLEDVEGHTKAIWTPRTYAIQTDLSGGITGAQASVYKRAKDALDQSLPLLDGLYPLDKEAKDEDVAALRATIRTQFTDLVKELGLLGGPRIARVTQLFSLLLGGTLPTTPQTPPPAVTSDPDQITGSLGNLRSLFGFGKDDDQVNTVADEQDLTNFRIVSDYVTSLAQSWVNNLQFFGLNTPTPFFGTQLVLLTRQLSVIAESVNEVRFTLDSVFIGPAERQTLQINFRSPPAPPGTPSMFLEDLLTWIDSFASEEGPRLIEDGGKLAVGESFVPIGTQLQTLVAGAVHPANAGSLPRGYRTARVQRSLEELRDQLQELVNLALPIHHIATPEPQRELAVLGISPNFIATKPATNRQDLTVIGNGFDVGGVPLGRAYPGGATVTIKDVNNTTLSTGATQILSDKIIFVQSLNISSFVTGPNEITIEVKNRNNDDAKLVTNFIILS